METYHSPGRSKLKIAREILRYFSNHPAAKDTLEGITRWWLQRELIERSVEEVAESLRLLVAHGLIIQRQARAGTPYYQVNSAKREEIARFLKKDEIGSGRNTA